MESLAPASVVEKQQGHGLVARRRTREDTYNRRRWIPATTAAARERFAGRAREELVAASAKPRRARQSGAEALTPSDLRVARMAAHGHTNREIAQALFVSLRTVEIHLTHSYRKLEISSRGELSVALERLAVGEDAASEE